MKAIQRCSIVVLLIFAVHCWGQKITASLSGTVRDSTQAVVPGAHVHITNKQTGRVSEMTTGQDGRFDAPSLPAGAYDISIELTGFKRLEIGRASCRERV